MLQIVRDELWITELLKSVQWEPDYEHPHMNESYVAIGVQDVGEEEIDLDSLLNGNVYWCLMLRYINLACPADRNVHTVVNSLHD